MLCKRVYIHIYISCIGLTFAYAGRPHISGQRWREIGKKSERERERDRGIERETLTERYCRMIWDMTKRSSEKGHKTMSRWESVLIQIRIQ